MFSLCFQYVSSFVRNSSVRTETNIWFHHLVLEILHAPIFLHFSTVSVFIGRFSPRKKHKMRNNYSNGLDMIPLAHLEGVTGMNWVQKLQKLTLRFPPKKFLAYFELLIF